MATISVLIVNVFSLFVSFLLHPTSVLTPFSHTIMDMRNKKRRNNLTHARVNLSVAAIDTLSLKSRRNVVAIFWARVLCRLVIEEARFRMRVTLGVILIRSLVNTKHVPGCLRIGSGVALN